MLVTVSDKKIQHSTDGTTVDYYNADIVTANDYYPFGMTMPGRKYNQGNSKYRYGFNGKENDNEVKGEGNQQDYGMRIYDPRLGRFLSVDPLSPKYPELTPYQFASNSPIQGIDLDGEELLKKVLDNVKQGKKWAEGKIGPANAEKIAKLIDLPLIAVTNKAAKNYYNDIEKLTTVQRNEIITNETSTKKQVAAALLYNFANGVGNDVTVIPQNSDFSKDYFSGFVVEDIKTSFYDKVNAMNLSVKDLKNGIINSGAKEVNFGIAVSPDHLNNDKEAAKKLSESTVAQIVIGGSNAHAVVSKTGLVTIVVDNPMSRNSLAGHVLSSYDTRRTSIEIEKPLSTTYQIMSYSFQLSAGSLSNKDANSKPKKKK